MTKQWQIYIFLSAISLIISALLGVNFLIIHTITGILLYLYSAYFKKIALLGNGVVAILSAISQSSLQITTEYPATSQVVLQIT